MYTNWRERIIVTWKRRKAELTPLLMLASMEISSVTRDGWVYGQETRNGNNRTRLNTRGPLFAMEYTYGSSKQVVWLFLLQIPLGRLAASLQLSQLFFLTKNRGRDARTLVVRSREYPCCTGKIYTRVRPFERCFSPILFIFLVGIRSMRRKPDPLWFPVQFSLLCDLRPRVL